MKLLDRIYFAFKNLTNPVTFDEAYDDGFKAGAMVAQARMEAALNEKYPYELKNEAFRFGYKHAVEVVKGNI